MWSSSTVSRFTNTGFSYGAISNFLNTKKKRNEGGRRVNANSRIIVKISTEKTHKSIFFRFSFFITIFFLLFVSSSSFWIVQKAAVYLLNRKGW